MLLKNLMISVSGVRGIVGDGLTPEVALKFANAYASTFGPGAIVVGRDSRVTGDMIKYAVWSGLMASGCDVIDLGIVPTPTTQLVTEKSEFSGGIIITASHNPAEWNALKLLSPQGLFLSPADGANVLARVQREETTIAPWQQMGRVIPYSTAIDEHLARIKELAIIDLDAIRRKKFKVVADCCHGAGGVILPQLFAALGCEAIFLHQEPTGLFPRSPEPIPENLVELAAAVRQHQADLGVAVDPDVDRLALISELGQPLGEELTLTLATQLVLSKTPGEVVTNASTTRALDDIAERFGCRVHRTPVGEIHVAMKADEIKAVIAGEGNGGVIYPPLHLGRDAMVGIALALQLLAESGQSLSSLQATLPAYVMIKDKISLPFGANAGNQVQALAARHPGETIDRIDGIKFLYPEAWAHVRASNTEPIIRIIVEAKTHEQAHRLLQTFKQEVIHLSQS